MTILFQMTKSSTIDKVIFQENQKDEEIQEYFENACGGVYKWWREVKTNENTELKRKYFEQYDKLPEEICEQTKINYDENFRIKYYHDELLPPETLTEALCNGFEWQYTEQKHEYWKEIIYKYAYLS